MATRPIDISSEQFERFVIAFAMLAMLLVGFVIGASFAVVTDMGHDRTPIGSTGPGTP
jgi:hypothetical protein